MELKFLGTGSAFYTELGNTSAYYQENDKLLLIDCGESVWAQIQKQGVLQNINYIFLMITHTHSDHIGSIGSFIHYCTFMLKKPLYIICAESPIQEDIKMICTIFGCPPATYQFLTCEVLCNTFDMLNDISFLQVFHTIELTYCYSIVLDTKDGIMLYTGDSTETKYITQSLNNPRLHSIYVDVTTTLVEVHLDIEILRNIVPANKREKVYCMHFNNWDCIQKASSYGFHIVSSTI